MELQDWAIEYVKARNAIRKTLHEYMIEGDEVTFFHKHKTHHFKISPQLVVPEVRDTYTVVCLNTDENIHYLLNNWEAFLQDNLTILFANPKVNASWQINPKLHSMIADFDTLKEGLQSMSSEVPKL